MECKSNISEGKISRSEQFIALVTHTAGAVIYSLLYKSGWIYWKIVLKKNGWVVRKENRSRQQIFTCVYCFHKSDVELVIRWFERVLIIRGRRDKTSTLDIKSFVEDYENSLKHFLCVRSYCLWCFKWQSSPRPWIRDRHWNRSIADDHVRNLFIIDCASFFPPHYWLNY